MKMLIIGLILCPLMGMAGEPKFHYGDKVKFHLGSFYGTCTANVWKFDDYGAQGVHYDIKNCECNGTSYDYDFPIEESRLTRIKK